MINTQYSELVFRQNFLSNKKIKNAFEDKEIKENAHKLTEIELSISAVDIIESIRDAFKHIPPRD